MELKRKGICKNFGNCRNADNKIIVEVDLTADFICPEEDCGQDLVPIEKKVFPLKKTLIPVSIIAFIALIIWGTISFNTWRKEKINMALEIAERVIKEIPKNSDSILDNNPISQVSIPASKEKSVEQSVPAVNKKSEANELDTNESATGELIANTLEDGLQKIGDTTYSQSQRKGLFSKMLARFENTEVPVKVLMNNNEYEYFTIEKYLNRILIQGINHISVKQELKNNSGLINELTVNE
jgi:hypothetical protein